MNCFICKAYGDLHRHHIYFGTGNRKKSEEHGFVVSLCPSCHLYGERAVHRCRETDLFLKMTMQREFEKTHTREEFMAIIGRSYL